MLDKASMERLNSQVESTSKALGEYVSQLDKELQERKEVQELLESFTYQQKQQLKSTKMNLEVNCYCHCVCTLLLSLFVHKLLTVDV